MRSVILTLDGAVADRALPIVREMARRDSASVVVVHVGNTATELNALVDALRAEGIEVRGPAPADTLFHPAARATYDAALCMYHDQALIPIKTIDFSGGVNVTLGVASLELRYGP